jgi:hypothetical protein
VSLTCCPQSAANKGSSIQQPAAGIQSCKSAHQQSTGKTCHRWTVWPRYAHLRVPGARTTESRDAGQQSKICRQACIEACHGKPVWRIPHSSPQGSTTSKTGIAAHLGLAAAGIWRKGRHDHSQAFSSQIRPRPLSTRASLTNTNPLKHCVTA